MQPHTKTPLTLGEIETQLKSAIASHADGENAYIRFDFGGAYPTGLDSYRGDYASICIEFSGDYDGNGKAASDFLLDIEYAYKHTFLGWKGGEYRMDTDSEVYVACSGCGSNTRVIGIEAREECIKILTTEVEN
jgi:hypothetical protein